VVSAEPAETSLSAALRLLAAGATDPEHDPDLTPLRQMVSRADPDTSAGRTLFTALDVAARRDADIAVAVWRLVRRYGPAQWRRDPRARAWLSTAVPQALPAPADGNPVGSEDEGVPNGEAAPCGGPAGLP